MCYKSESSQFCSLTTHLHITHDSLLVMTIKNMFLLYGSTRCQAEITSNVTSWNQTMMMKSMKSFMMSLLPTLFKWTCNLLPLCGRMGTLNDHRPVAMAFLVKKTLDRLILFHPRPLVRTPAGKHQSGQCYHLSTTLCLFTMDKAENTLWIMLIDHWVKTIQPLLLEDELRAMQVVMGYLSGRLGNCVMNTEAWWMTLFGSANWMICSWT